MLSLKLLVKMFLLEFPIQHEWDYLPNLSGESEHMVLLDNQDNLQLLFLPFTTPELSDEYNCIVRACLKLN